MAKSIKGVSICVASPIDRIFPYANDCVKLILSIVFYAENDKGTITEKPGGVQYFAMF